jgi:ribonuclease BN (tRNA processing enzyme)
MNTITRSSVFVVLALVSASFRTTPAVGNTGQSSRTTQVVLLGTGTPGWDPDSSGPSTAIVVNGTPYLIDFGPGVVRRAGAAYKKGVEALLPTNLHVVFLTHRHIDHTVGYSDLIFSPAQIGEAEGRKLPLEVYGPKGLAAMTENILKAHLPSPNDARFKVNAHEITPGVVYKDDNVTVTAFLVAHANLEAFGYRFDTPDRTIVISGDTTPTQSVIDNCHGCDVLIHESYSMKTYDAVSEQAQANRKRLHTSTLQLAELAGKAKPKLLILYHRSNLGGVFTVPNPEAAFLEEIRQTYTGKVVIGHDLEIY